jgi:chorismate mutase
VGDIAALRRRIDGIDVRLVALLNERAGCALEIGRLKEHAGEPIYQPVREAEVLANVRAANRGPLDAAALARLFERIIDEARRLERTATASRQASGGSGSGAADGRISRIEPVQDPDKGE